MKMTINRMRILDLISIRENSAKRVYRKYGGRHGVVMVTIQCASPLF